MRYNECEMNKKSNVRSVLIIEDESIVALELEDFTSSNGYVVVDVVDNYDDALRAVQNNHVDIVLCDIYINGTKTGIEFVRDVKKAQDIKVIYLTAFADEDTISKAIDTEPSSYLTKPFKREELYAALKLASKGDELFDMGYGYSYDVKAGQLFYKNSHVLLTKKEHILLKLLIQQNKRVLTLQQMEYEIWPHKSVSNGARRTLIYRLNHKLKYPLVKTIPGVGYQLSIFYQ